MTELPVLLVYHEPMALRLMESMLNRAGYQTLTVTSRREAMDICQNQPISLVVLDYFLPEPESLAVLTMIRHDPALSRIPIILVDTKHTPSNTPEARELAREMLLQANGYLCLPFASSEFVDKVRCLLSAQARTDN